MSAWSSRSFSAAATNARAPSGVSGNAVASVAAGAAGAAASAIGASTGAMATGWGGGVEAHPARAKARIETEAASLIGSNSFGRVCSRAFRLELSGRLVKREEARDRFSELGLGNRAHVGAGHLGESGIRHGLRELGGRTVVVILAPADDQRRHGEGLEPVHERVLEAFEQVPGSDTVNLLALHE